MKIKMIYTYVQFFHKLLIKLKLMIAYMNLLLLQIKYFIMEIIKSKFLEYLKIQIEMGICFSYKKKYKIYLVVEW
jgi:hypothetical protein